MSLYIDGVLVNTEPYLSSEGYYLPPESLEIGADWYQTGISAPFDGLIDDVRLYNRALSKVEVAALYAYERSQPPSPSAATGTVNILNGFVVGATLSDGGYGHTNTPLVKLIGGGGTGAEAVAVLSNSDLSNGVVIAVNILNAGSGYTTAPVLVIEPPFIEQPTISIAPMSVLSFTNLAVGTNYQFQVFVAGTWSNLAAAFTDTGSTFTQTVSGAASAGEYRLAASPVFLQAYATPQVTNGFVVGAVVLTGGSGYTTIPTVTITGDGGSNATAIATVSGGAVTGITVINAGNGYTNTVLITIAPPPANSLAPAIALMMELDLGNLAPYDNYQLQASPTTKGAWTNLGLLFTPVATVNTQYVNASGPVGFFRAKYAP